MLYAPCYKGLTPAGPGFSLAGMNFASRTVLFAVCFACACASPPKTSEGPAGAAERMFASARAQEERGDLAGAADLYLRLVEDLPGSALAPEALRRRAECLEKSDELYEAFQAYQEILDKYPGQGSLNEILSRQFRIGEAYLAGRKRDLIFFPIRSGLPRAEEIFAAIVKTAPFSALAPAAQLNLGLAVQRDGRYREAEVEYDRLLENYPGSPEAVGALYGKISCSYELSRGVDYEQDDTRRCLKLMEIFLQRYPDSDPAPEVREMLSEMRDRLAEREYKTGRYYESKGNPLGATIYYRTLISKYPLSARAQDARERIEKLAAAAAEQEAATARRVAGGEQGLEVEEGLQEYGGEE